MASLQEHFANFVSGFLRLIGVRKSDAAKRQQQLDGWQDKRRALADEVEALKNDVRTTEDHLRAKSRELAATRGENRSIVEEEIKSLLRELDLKKQKQNVLFAGIDRMNALTERLKEITSAGKGSVDAEVIRQLQAEMSVVLLDLKDVDRETAKLAALQYRGDAADPQHYEARKAQATNADATSTSAAPTAAQAEPSRLSEAEQQRLARIVGEAN